MQGLLLKAQNLDVGTTFYGAVSPVYCESGEEVVF